MRPTSSVHMVHGRSNLSSVLGLNPNYHSFRQVSLAPLELEQNPQQEQQQNLSNTAPKPILHMLSQNKLSKPSGISLGQIRSVSKQDQITRKSVGLPALKPLNPRSQLPKLNPLGHSSVQGLSSFPVSLSSDDFSNEIQKESGFKTIHIIPTGKAPRPLTPPIKNPLEFEPPSVLAIASKKNYTKLSEKMPKLPLLPSINDPGFPAILKEKVKICNFIFEFNTETPGLTEDQDVKSRALCEFVQFFEQSLEARKLPEDLQALIFSIIEQNILQQVPVFPDVLLSNNYQVPVVEPCWPHLFYCFQILNRFVQLFPESPLMTVSIAKKTIKLLSLPDNNERLQLLAFLRSFYDLHSNDRNELIKYATQFLIEYKEKQLPPYCVPPLLVFAAHVFTRSGKNINSQYLSLLRNGVFPLIKSPHIHVFLQHLVQLLTSLFSENSLIAEEFFDYIVHNWETTDSKIKGARIEILIFVCSKIRPETASQNSKRIFNILSKELLSVHQRIVLAVLSLWLKPKLDEYVEKDSKYAVGIMYENVKRISEIHWSPLIREKASQALAEMGKLNRNQFLKMRNQKGTSDQRRKRFEIEHKAMKTWAHIAKDIYEFTNYKIEIKPKLNEIKEYFDFKTQDASSTALFQKFPPNSNK